MKTQPIFLLLALVLGIGIGWLIKPTSETTAAGVGASDKIPARAEERPRVVSDDGADESGEDPLRRKKTHTVVIGGDNDAEMTPEEQAMQDQIAKAMRDSQSKADERKIMALVEKLGLDATQEAELRNYFSERRDRIAALFSSESNEVPDMTEFSESKFDELMAGVLTDEQKESYEEVKTAEREKKVESRALKDLAKLNSIIDLRADQKDEVYAVLYEDAGSKVDKAAESGMSAFGAMFGGGMGIEMDLESADMHGSFYLEGSDSDGEPREFSAEAFKEAQQKRVDDKVERLSGVLDDGQLDAYREHLESQGSVFGSFVSPALEE